MTKSIFIASLLACCLIGCKGDAADTGKEMSSTEIQQKVQQNAANPNLPPQAQAAIGATGRYNGSNEYAQSQNQGKGGGK
ncbi:MAG: hypothetical protein ACAH95_02600 [Fimbriimonas sp.]